MPLISDEQSERRPSQFLKLEDKAKLTILSNLYKVKTHFLQGQKVSVKCVGEDCYFCSAGVKARMEFFYFGKVNDVEGIVRVPASVFFQINESERVLEMDKRQSVWVVSKKGSGLETEYGVARGKDAGESSLELSQANAKLTQVLDPYTKNLEDKYKEYAQTFAAEKIFGGQAEDSVEETE